MVEKHGGLWLEDNDGEIAFEEYDRSTDRLQVVYRRGNSLYRACLYTKSHDPQWALPWWSTDDGEAWFSSVGEAVEFFSRL